MFGRILIVALVIGGLGGAVIGNCETKVIDKSAGQSVDKVIVKTVIEIEPSIVTQSGLVHRIPRAVTEASDGHAKRQNSGSSVVGPSSKGVVTTSKGGATSSATGQSSGSVKQLVPPKNPKAPGGTGAGSSKPPKNKPNKGEPNKESDSHWAVFLQIFNKKTLEEITIKGIKIFNKVNKEQKKVLRDIIVDIRRSKYLDLAKIVDITTKLFSKLQDNEVTFQNYQSIIKFVVVYVDEMIAERNDAYNDKPSEFPKISQNYEKRREQFAEIITSENIKSIDTLSNFLKDLANEIDGLMKKTNPQFINKYAAVYHYSKHKRIPGTDKELTAIQYFDIAKKILDRLDKIPQYQQLKRDGEKRIIYEKYYSEYGRRLMIVLKFQREVWNLSSCYFIDEDKGDKDGDEWINDKKLP